MYYAIMFDHFRSYVVDTVVRIMLLGYPVRKMTRRNEYEWFYRVPFEKLVEVQLR